VITVEEIGGGRKLELRGSSLPFYGAEWGTAQRLVTKWYAGNTIEATQQVLGPIELPSQWEGEWNTTRLVGSPAKYTDDDGTERYITRASTLRDVCDGLFYSGALCRVTWASTLNTPTGMNTRRVVREGRAKEWRFPHTRADDIRWSIEWEWIGRGGRQQRVVAFRDEGTEALLRDVIVSINEATAAIESSPLVSSNRAVKNSATPFTLGQLEAFLDGPNQLMRDFARFANSITNRMKRIGDMIKKVRGMTASLAGQALDVSTNAIAVCNQFVDDMSRPAPETLATKQKVSSMLTAASYFGEGQTQAGYVQDANVRLARIAQQRRNALLPGNSDPNGRMNTNGVLTVHIGREGDTLPGISSRYYGTPDRSDLIAIANGLPAYQVEIDPGEIIVVPLLKNADTSKEV
jgi:hypothetical protein